MSPNPRVAELDDDLLERICSVAEQGVEITTLTQKRANRIVGVDRSGVLVETARSDRLGTGPQLVPAWMIVTAWQHLRGHGELSQVEF